MEKSKQIIAQNSATIKAMTDTISLLLKEVVLLDEENAVILESKEEVVDDTLLRYTRVSSHQCAVLCTLNKVVMELETMLLEKHQTCSHTDASIQIIEDKVHCTEQEPVKDVVQKAVESKIIEAELTPEKVKNIEADVIQQVKQYEEATKDVCFKPTGKKVSSKIKKTKIPCYVLRDRPPPGLDTLCTISHVESPSEFYIHVIDEEVANIDAISEIIRETYSRTRCRYNNKQTAHEELGNFCVAYLEKFDQWYRVEMLDWFLESEEEVVKIQLVDYGSNYYTSYKNLRNLFPSVQHYPRLAQLCYLQNLSPLGQENCMREQYKWPASVVDTFLDLLGPNLEVFEVVFVKSHRHSIGIDLLKENEDSSVSEQLLKLGLAAVTLMVDEKEEVQNKFIVQQVLGAQGVMGLPTMTEDEKMTRFFETTLPLERTEDINEAVADYSPTDEKRICKFQTKCRKRNCKLEHAPLTKGFTTDRLQTYSRAATELNLPKAGDTILARITYVKTVCNFYIHLNPTPDDAGYSQFLQMEETMNHPKTINAYRTVKLLPALGDIVVVKNWDGRWCRAQVRHVRGYDNGESVYVQVFIVDFGEVVDVNLSDVRQIEEDFLRVPFQAVECRLFNAVANDDAASADEGRVYMEFSFMCSNYRTKVIANVGYLEVLMSVEGDLGEHLVHKGFAVKKPNGLVPRENELLLVE